METHLPQIEPTQSAEPNQPIPTYTTYVDCTVSRLTCTSAEQKTVPTAPNAPPSTTPQTYYIIPLMYNFASTLEADRKLNDFLYEGCEMDSPYGIQTNEGQSGRKEYSVMCKFDLSDAENVRFIESTNEIHRGCAFILHSMKGVVKLPHFNASTPEMIEATGLKNPIFRPRDPTTSEIVQGRAPSMYLKLFSRGKPPMVEQTLFTGLDGKPIPWALLQGVEMKFIPLILVKRIYIGGGKASIQMEVQSAIVTFIRARNTSTRQTTTIQRLQQARPALQDTVSAQLAKLTLDRQEQMLGSMQPQQPAQSSSESQPTYAGITSTGQHPGTLPSIPPLGGPQPSMQELTSSAPTRSPVIPMAGVPQGQFGATLSFS
jgi:hypothetical protein